MRNIFSVALAGLVLLFSAPNLHAQRKQQVRDSSVTIVFAENATPSKKGKQAGDENIVKIAPLGFISGVFPLAYERRLSDFITLEVAGGLTNRNYIRSAFVKEEGDFIKEESYPWSTSSGAYDEAEALYNFDSRKPEMGFMYRIMPKIYFEDEAPDGNYVGFQYNFLKYKFSIPKLTKTANGDFKHNGGTASEYENVTDYMVYFGRQVVNDRITVESSSGIGIRKVKGMKYVASTANGVVLDGLAPYSQSTFNFGISFTLGYHF